MQRILSETLRSTRRIALRIVTMGVVAATMSGGWVVGAEHSDGVPPAVAREFRGVWIATVENIDWPSRRGLSTDQQKRELVAILDKCLELKLNAVIFQVRTQADAFYASELEPWSEFLTGTMGKPPEPFYDPLEFAVTEAHQRGLQLHVWFNPYRVRVPTARGAASPDHASIAQAAVVRKYGNYLWFDPGEPAAEERFIAVLKDVVERYDVNGVHIDDYFYPYPVNDDKGKRVPFPDDSSYTRAMANGPRLDRDDWRRQNVNRLVRRMYDEVKKTKPWVLVGISPFGIWRPGHPPEISGLDQYSTLYADARKWQQEGWLDYLTPQLYWQIDSKGQSYPKLLTWWSEQNAKRRHLWPGNFTSQIPRRPASSATSGWTADELIRQIEITRETPGATGNVHFSMKALLQNRDGISDKLKKGLYAEPALVPETPWLGQSTPARPEASAEWVDGKLRLQIRMAGGQAAWQWLVRLRTSGGWRTHILPGTVSEQIVATGDDTKPAAVVVSAISRLGREGRPARVEVENSR